MFPRHMYATKADHKLGDISREEYEPERLMQNVALIKEFNHEKRVFVGAWETGGGFFNVEFPEDTTRDLTPEEVTFLETRQIQYPGMHPQQMKIVGYDGPNREPSHSHDFEGLDLEDENLDLDKPAVDDLGHS